VRVLAWAGKQTQSVTRLQWAETKAEKPECFSQQGCVSRRKRSKRIIKPGTAALSGLRTRAFSPLMKMIKLDGQA
jgi:hypothetical protein